MSYSYVTSPVLGFFVTLMWYYPIFYVRGNRYMYVYVYSFNSLSHFPLIVNHSILLMIIGTLMQYYFPR